MNASAFLVLVQAKKEMSRDYDDESVILASGNLFWPLTGNHVDIRIVFCFTLRHCWLAY